MGGCAHKCVYMYEWVSVHSGIILLRQLFQTSRKSSGASSLIETSALVVDGVIQSCPCCINSRAPNTHTHTQLVCAVPVKKGVQYRQLSVPLPAPQPCMGTIVAPRQRALCVGAKGTMPVHGDKGQNPLCLLSHPSVTPCHPDTLSYG